MERAEYKNASVSLADTSQTAVYTCPSDRTALVNMIHVANDDGTNAATIKIELTDSSASATFVLCQATSIAAGEYVNIIEKPLVLEAGDIIKATASAGGDLDVIVSVRELLPAIY